MIASLLKKENAQIREISKSLKRFTSKVAPKHLDEFLVCLVSVANLSRMTELKRTLTSSQKDLRCIRKFAKKLSDLLIDSDCDLRLFLNDQMPGSLLGLEGALYILSKAPELPPQRPRQRLEYIFSQVQTIFAIDRFELQASKNNDGFMAESVRAVCNAARVKIPDDIRHIW